MKSVNRGVSWKSECFHYSVSLKKSLWVCLSVCWRMRMDKEIWMVSGRYHVTNSWSETEWVTTGHVHEMDWKKWMCEGGWCLVIECMNETETVCEWVCERVSLYRYLRGLAKSGTTSNGESGAPTMQGVGKPCDFSKSIFILKEKR